MKFYVSILSFMFLLLISSCKKNEDSKPLTLPEGIINLTDLKTRHDYYLPFAILNNTPAVKSAVLNNETIKFGQGEFTETKENGFFSLVLKYSSNQASDTFLFTTTTKEREASEWGIRAWTPVAYTNVLLGSEELEAFYPHRYTDAINVPFVFYVKESGAVKTVYSQGKASLSQDNFNIKRGVGSVNISSSSVTDNTEFIIGGKRFNASLSKIVDTPVIMTGNINSNVDIPANSFVKIAGNLNITSSGSLTIHEGTVVLIDEAVDINLSGPLLITGSPGNPVLMTCSGKDKFWGGFITRVSGGTINAKYAIFCQSGYHNTEGYYWGHAGRQALFYTEKSTLTLDHCFILDHEGQIFYPQNAVLNFNNILVQRAYTGGQINTSKLTLKNSVFTDFPDDSYKFADLDNDALYLSASDANIDSCTFMFAKDDGLDSGNTEGGNIVVTNSRFEACFHEGAALSSGDLAVKSHIFRNCIFTNCGQGLELGFSSPNHVVLADNCQFLNNGVGIRYGDNYDWAEVDGKMNIKNSRSIGNDKDVWNMVRMIWSPKLKNLTFENTFVSKLCPQYPELVIKKQ
jgi:hypothetical protein